MNLLPLEPPSRDLHFTPLVSTEHQAELPVLSSSFPLAPCFNHQFSSFHLLSHVQVFATPWTAAPQASLCKPGLLSITNSQSLLKLMSIESVMPSNHLILSLPFSSPLQSFPASGAFQMSQLFASGGQSIRVSAPSNEYSGLISRRIDWLDFLAVQGNLKTLLQHHSSKASILRHSAFFTVQLSHTYMTTGKTIHSLD